MTSHLANLFSALQTLIAGLEDDDRNPYFRFVDQDLGQLEVARPPVTWPCVLIDIDDVVYKCLGGNVQTGIATVKFRVGFPPFSSGSGITPNKSREQALYYYDLEHLLHLALQGTLPAKIVDDQNILAPIFGHLDRISATTEHRKDTIRVRALTYSIALQDFTTKPVTVITPAAMDLSFEWPE